MDIWGRGYTKEPFFWESVSHGGELTAEQRIGKLLAVDSFAEETMRRAAEPCLFGANTL